MQKKKANESSDSIIKNIFSKAKKNGIIDNIPEHQIESLKIVFEEYLNNEVETIESRKYVINNIDISFGDSIFVKRKHKFDNFFKLHLMEKGDEFTLKLKYRQPLQYHIDKYVQENPEVQFLVTQVEGILKCIKIK